MSWIDGARARLALLFSRGAADARFGEEIRFHIEMETERLRRQEGLGATEARRRALVAFGGVEDHRESLRDGRGLRWLGGLKLDLTLGLRMLAKWPGLTLVGVLGMAVAVAIGTVSFGFIYTVIGSDVPIDEGHRVVMIENWDARSSSERGETHLHDMAVWRTSLSAIDDISAYRLVERNLIVTGARPEPVQIAEISASAFRLVRVAPQRGRYLLDEDERPGVPPVVVIGDDVWRNRFASDPEVVGRTMRLGATVHTVVGVMPPGFAFPVNNRMWTPLRLDPLAFESGDAPAIKVFGRLGAGASMTDAETQATNVSQQLAATRPPTFEPVRTRVLRYGLAFAENPGMVWLMHLVQLAISMLMVVIGINVATLVYARTAGRMGEIAVRTALGASRARIVGQLFAEAFVLSALATALGLALALVALDYLQSNMDRLAAGRMPYWWSLGLSTGMVLYVFGLAMLAAIIVGALPALKATGRGVRANLQQLGAGGGGMRLGRSWTVLIVAQVAVAVAMVPVVLHLFVVRPRTDRIEGPTIATSPWITASLRLDRESTEGGGSRAADSLLATRYTLLAGEMVRRLRADPAFSDVVLASDLPGNEGSMRVETDVTAAPGSTYSPTRSSVETVGTSRVDADFFRAFGIPVVSGRPLQPGDVSARASVVVVNQSFVREVLGGGNAVGRRVRQAPAEGWTNAGRAAEAPWQEIVGVVSDFQLAQGSTRRQPLMYQPMLSVSAQTVAVAAHVRSGAASALSGRMREIAVAVDPMLRLEQLRTLDESTSLETVMDQVIFSAIYLVTLSVVLLSAAGIYALLSFTIARRRREIGIRAALGAGSRQVVGVVLAKSARQIGIGTAIGLVLAGALIQSIEGWTWEPGSMVSLGAVALFMGVVGIAAAWGPTRAALAIQPTEALRAD